MKVRSVIHTVLCFIIIISGITGIIFQTCGNGSFSPESLKMFTTLSNIFVILYYIIAVIVFLKTRKTFCPAWRFMSLISIMLTGIVAATMLSGMGNGADLMTKAALDLLHIVVPVATFIDWLFFSEKGKFRNYYFLYGMIPALLYLGASMILAHFGSGLGMNGGKYPYPFLDIDSNGLQTVVLTCVVMGLAIALVGIIITIIDRSAGISGRKKKK